MTPGDYHSLDAFIKPDQVGYDDDGISASSSA